MKLHPTANQRTLMENGQFGFLGDCTPEDVDNSPEFFDGVVNDLIDPEKYIQSPLASGLGTLFVLFLGNVHKEFDTAQFRVDGLRVVHMESGAKQYELLWSRVTEWNHVNVAERLTRSAHRKAPRKEELAA